MVWIECLSDGWFVARGDPGGLAWVITLAYAFNALIILAYSRLAPRTEWRFWIVLALALAVLGLNKQIDLQTSMNIYGKCVAKAQGWYAQRRAVQAVFVAVFLLAGLAALIAGLGVVRARARAVGGVIAGGVILFAYVAMRAMHIQHVDEIWGARLDLAGSKLLLEAAALALIGANMFVLLARAGARAEEN